MVIINIRSLLQVRSTTEKWVAGTEMGHVPSIEQAYLRIVDGRISDFGTMNDLILLESEELVDAEGGLVLPAFVDSHSHLVFAETREHEFVEKN